MANPQVEDGHLKIALSLVVALGQEDKLRPVHFRILLVIMHLTWGANKKCGLISVDDIRYQLGGSQLVRAPRVEKWLDELAEMNFIVRTPAGNGQIIGIQKDFEQWHNRSNRTSGTNKRYIYINNITISTPYQRYQRSVKDILVQYVQARSTLKLTGVKQLSIDAANARRLYTKITQLTHDPAEALLVTRDFLDHLLDDPWVQEHVKMKFTFALGRLDAWWRQIPAKPRSVKENETVTGYRFRYNIRTKQWEITDERSGD